MLDGMSLEDFEKQLESTDITETAPKRGRRPSLRGARDKKPREAKPRPTTRAKPRHNISAKIEAWLLIANGLAAAYPPIRDDLLDDAEIKASAEAINAVAQENAQVYKALDTIVSGGAFFQVAMVAGIIGMRRAARHGMIAANLDEVGGQLLSANPADMMNFMVGEDATEATSTADD